MNTTSGHTWWVLSWHMLPCSVSVTLPKICPPWGSRRPPDISTSPGGAPGTLAPAYLEPCVAGRRCLEPRSPPGGGRRAAAAARGASRAASSCWVQIPIELGARGRQRKARSRRQPGEAGLQRWFQRLGPGEGRAGGRASVRRRLQQLEEGPAAASGDSEASRHFSWPLFGLAAELCPPQSAPQLPELGVLGTHQHPPTKEGTHCGAPGLVWEKTLSSVAVRVFSSSQSGPQGVR